MGVFDKVTKVGTDVAIALVVIGLIWGNIITGTYTQGVDAAISAADANNYTLTKAVLTTWKTADGFILSLLFIAVTLNVLVSAFYRRKGTDTKDLTQDTVSLILLFMIFGILLFQLGVANIIAAKIIPDSYLSSLLSVLYALIVISTIGLFRSTYSTYSRKRGRRTSTISILGR